MLRLKQMSVQELKALETTIITETANEPDPLEKSKLSLLLWVVQRVLVVDVLSRLLLAIRANLNQSYSLHSQPQV